MADTRKPAVIQTYCKHCKKNVWLKEVIIIRDSIGSGKCSSCNNTILVDLTKLKPIKPNEKENKT